MSQKDRIPNIGSKTTIFVFCSLTLREHSGDIGIVKIGEKAIKVMIK